MSQRDVETLLGRLLTDHEFRARFYRDPASVCIAEGFEVSVRELEAVAAIQEAQLAAFSTQLDERIVRASIEADAEAPAFTPERRRSAGH